MTKIGKIIQEEIQQAVDESVAWTKRETRKKTSLDIAKECWKLVFLQREFYFV